MPQKEVILKASGLEVASGQTAAITGISQWTTATLLLDVTASDTPTTLDVFLQRLLPDGVTWDDVAHFQQVGAVSTVQDVADLFAGASGGGVRAPDDVAMAEGARDLPWAETVRIKWVLVGTSYTFAVTASFRV